VSYYGYQRLSLTFFLALAALAANAPRSECAVDRFINGSWNHLGDEERGSAGQPLIRINYLTDYQGIHGGIILPPTRPNARTISNTVSKQTVSTPSARGLSDFIWGWGQFLDHDMSLSSTSAANGTAPISIDDPNDPFGQGNSIAFNRSNFTINGDREQINDVTAWIDGSQIYGSSDDRAKKLRTNDGAGAKLKTSANNLLPYNTGGLTNQNNGPTPASQLFLAGDIRANENFLLTSLQTVFMREHNRLVDRIAVLKPSLNAQEQYNLARKLVGAEIQAITYNEFLPALMGANAPTAQGYAYQPDEDGSITNSFSHAVYRFGHSALGDSLLLANNSGQATGSIAFASAFFNPNQITNNPALIEQTLMGASLQKSQEIDLKIVDSIRNVMFGPPGAGGTDLMAVDIQRGRDHGIVDYNELRAAYNLSTLTSFNQLPTGAATRNALKTLYGDNINNVDAIVAALAETHLAGSSLGPLTTAILASQFTRSRDGDRFFYTGNVNGLYANGVLNADIAAILNLNTLKLADVIRMNTGLTNIADSLFFAQTPSPATPIPGDFNNDGVVNNADLVIWKSGFAAGAMTGADYLEWQRNFGVTSSQPSVAGVPEPTAALLGIVGTSAAALLFRRRAAAAA
jgi:peroxidase